MLKQLLHTNTSVGIEYTTHKGVASLNLLTLKKQKKELVLENTKQYTSFKSLEEELTKQIPVFLIINNEQVLSKEIEGIFEPEKAVALTFPNLKQKDFYCEVLHGNTNTFISICRKEYIDSIIALYQKGNHSIIGFSLGNLAVSQLCDFVKNTTLQTSTSSISFDSQTIREITANSDIDYSVISTINGLQITPNNILPLAGILTYYTGQKHTSSNFDTLANNLNDDFKQKRIFELILKTGLAAVFVLLLISFLLFSNYTSNIDQLNAELEVNKTHKKTLLKLTDAIQKKEQLVTSFSLTSSKSSWYLDQLGSAVPGSVLLSEIQYQPLIKGIKKEEEILLEKRIISIKGTSNNANDFSNWTHELEMKNWIEKVIIEKYGTGKKMTTEFGILIEIKK